MPAVDQVHVSGQVTSNGEPVKIGSVELHNATDDIVDTVLVDGEGKYSFNLSPGTWRLCAWDVTGARGEVTVELRSGADQNADIQIED